MGDFLNSLFFGVYILADNEMNVELSDNSVPKSREPVKKARRPLLEIKNITKKYGDNVAVDNVD